MAAPDPARYLTETIPELFATARGHLSDAQRAARLAIGFVLADDRGDTGSWTLRFEDGDLRVEEGVDEDCVLVVRQPLWAWRQAWREAERSGGDPLAELARNPQQIDAALAERLRQVHGTLRALVVEGDEPVWEISLRFGRGPETPQATVTLRSEDVEAMRSGQLQPQQAMLGGRLRIEGDMALAMQVASLAMLRRL